MKRIALQGNLSFSRERQVPILHTSEPEIVCVSALSGGAAGGGNRKWTVYSLLILHCHVFMETWFSFHACVRIRHPVNHGNGNRTLAHFHFGKSGNRENRRTPIKIHSRLIFRGPAGSTKRQKHTLSHGKSVTDCSGNSLARARNHRMLHF